MTTAAIEAAHANLAMRLLFFWVTLAMISCVRFSISFEKHLLGWVKCLSEQSQ